MQTLAPDNVVYEFGKFALDPDQRTFFADGVPQHLPAKEFDTLLLLVENNRKALRKEEMMTRIWQDSFVEEVNLAKQISRLRKMLNADGGCYIETLPKHGYRFSADLRWTARTIDEPLIVEKRTVKRLTVSIEGEAEREVSTKPAAKRLRFGWLIVVVLPIVAVVGLGYFALSFNRNDVIVLQSREPVRLTDSTYHDTGPSWTRDGRIRFHRIYSKDRHVTLIMDADGSGQSELTAADGRRIFSWSPDETKVLFQKNGDLAKIYLANADGSEEILLPFGGGNWSPDSRMLTYHAKVAEHHYDIFVYSVETGEIRGITNDKDFDADPSFSPDGKRIVFSSGRDGNAEIYSIGLDGGDFRRLTSHPATDSHAAYSPDGTAILFTSDRENENADVYVMNANGGDPVKLTAFDKSNETAGPGGWSPDGTQIAFFSDRNGKDDIYVTSAETVRPKVVLSDPQHDLHTPAFSPDGESVVYNVEAGDKTGELRVLDFYTGRTRLVRKTELPVTTPMWSPDGGHIAFVDRINGNSEVCAVNADGSGFANLSNDPSVDISPSWSPAGTRLAFVSHRGEPSVGQLYTMNADGTDPRTLTPRKGWEGDPIWLPDSGKLVFVCDRADSPGNVLDICQINADGTGERRLLSNPNYDTQPAVSPDGARIAFVALSDGNPEIYVMNIDGSGLLRLTRDPADDLSPNWSPDDKKLIFTSNRTGRSAIYEILF